MSKFLSPLEVRALDDVRWALITPLGYQSDVLGSSVTVPPGFVTDFASVPRLPVVFELTGDTAHAAAVVHDWLYTSQPVPRAMADAVLREASIASGVSAWRAWMMWAGVRLGGESHWSKT